MDAVLSPFSRKHPRRRLLVGLGAVATLGLAGLAARPWRTAEAGPWVIEGPTMGTSYTVKIATPGLGPARLERVQADIHDAFTAIDQRMSVYLPQSELSRLNAQPAGRLAVSPALFEVLDAASEIARLSAGAFDPTIAPVADAWGFGPSRSRELPSAATLEEKRRTVGHAGLGLDPATRTVLKAQDGLALDLGGIAKGKGADAAASALLAAGVEDFMVEAGGEIVTRGLNAEGRPWAIGIEEPDTWPRRARLVLASSNEAIATSGDYRLYVEHGGRRYPHAIDPATATPIGPGLASVSVITGDAMHADALATALLVQGLERGLRLADQLGLEAHFISRDAGGRLLDHPSAARRERRAGQPA